MMAYRRRHAEVPARLRLALWTDDCLNSFATEYAERTD
jgi:hypothetical protein